MSLPPWQDTVNPTNQGSQHWRDAHSDVPKRRGKVTASDWIITWFIIGIFGLGAVATFLQ